MAGYSHITWTCPFFTWDEKTTIHCEGGKIRFPDAQAKREYAKAYCARDGTWQECSVAAALMHYYDRKEDSHEGKHAKS